MGTLHSAASVIQIHFRYLKHLKEAGLLKNDHAMNNNPRDNGSPLNQLVVLNKKHGAARKKTGSKHETKQGSNLYVDSDEEDGRFEALLRQEQQMPCKDEESLRVSAQDERSSQEHLQEELDLLKRSPPIRSLTKSNKLSLEDDGLSSGFINTTEKKNSKAKQTLSSNQFFDFNE